ncbi:MAG: hypothetical protein ABR608_05765 [Pseudonocardiaceae bacterium]
MVTELLTEGDLDRGHPPDLKSPYWRCSIVDPDSGAVSTLRPHGDDQPHEARERVMGTVRRTRVTTWTDGTERAMVVDGYTWTVLAGH